MRILSLLLMSLLIASPAMADDCRHDGMLNKVVLKLTAEQWVATKSALVSVTVNASVNGSGLDKVQDEVLKKLSDISSQGEWHITSFDRSLDTSGLEKVVITAQARVPSNALSNLRDRAKQISKPGETFNLDNVAFTPSEDELRQANADLRTNIYVQAKDELDRLNKLYSDQHYFVHDIDFVGDLVNGPIVVPGANYMRAMAAPMAASPGLAVGDKLIITATITLAAPPADHNLLKSIT
jgi:hypothetical protein